MGVCQFVEEFVDVSLEESGDTLLLERRWGCRSMVVHHELAGWSEPLGLDRRRTTAAPLASSLLMASHRRGGMHVVMKAHSL